MVCGGWLCGGKSSEDRGAGDMSGASSFDVAGWGAKDSSGKLELMKFQRKEPGPNDIKFKVHFCGICHTDLHFLRNEWKSSIYPMVPGHEIVGVVTEVGKNVKKFKPGDHAGVGFIVDSCRKCGCCQGDAEQFCERLVQTFNTKLPDGRNTMGGYSSFMVTDEKFCVKIPKNLPMDAAAPLLCAGITVYSPMHHFGMNQKGKSFGVVGLGGLGHMAVKFGKAFGMRVTVISTSISKEKEARELLGADDFLVSKDDNQMKKYAKSLDYIIDTVSATHPLEPLLNLLKFDGKLVIVGVPEHPLELPAGAVVFGRKMVAGSFIGSIKEAQEMMDFCGKNNVTSIVEVIPMDYVNEALVRLEKADVKYRFVLDVAKTLPDY